MIIAEVAIRHAHPEENEEVFLMKHAFRRFAAIIASTTIVTFLMVFLIQNTQNRDAVTIQLKLDELLSGVVGARTSLVDLENLSDDDLALLHQQFARLQISAAKSEQDAAKEAAVDGR